MFIIDGTSDFSDAVARLARLMYNIERGAKVYEWVKGSRSEPAPRPGPNVLTISIPGVTASPPTKVDYLPAVGFVYYVPSRPPNLRTLVAELATLLDNRPQEHLVGSLPVETTAHGSLYHRGRVYLASLVALKPGEVLPGEWSPSRLYPSRYFVTHTIPPSKPPQHVSYLGAFTWHIMPITAALEIKQFSSFADVNAIVSAVYLDTFCGGLEPLTPVTAITLDLFKIPPLPTMLAQLDEFLDIHLIFVSKRGGDAGTFDLAGASSDYQTSNKWQPPVCKLNARRPRLKNLDNPGLTSVCRGCSVPLWGDVFAVPDHSSPGYVAICMWCCGCIAERTPSVRITTGWTRAQAFQGLMWARVLPLLDVPVTRITAERWVGFIVQFEDGQRVVIESGGRGGEATPVCLRQSKLRDVRLPCYGLRYGIKVRTE